jgi:hypothetical protein
MLISENMLIYYNDKTILRVLYLDNINKNLVVINMEEEKMPYFFSLDMICEDIENKKAKIIEDNYIRKISEDNIGGKEKEKRESAWQILSFLLTKVKENELYFTKYRNPLIKEVAKIFGVNNKTVKNYLVRYFKYGKIKNALLPKYFNCGLKGVEKSSSDKKRGRPSANGKEGVNVDDRIKVIFKKGLNKYYYNQKQNNLKITYELIVRDNFVKEYIKDKGKNIPMLMDKSEIPTYGQFFYWFTKLNNTKTEVSRRYGERIYNQNNRSIIGSSTQEAELGPGTLWQIDSTIFDVYLVSSLNRNNIVGRPVLFLVMDVFSRMIIGVNITLESFNSYSGAMLALTNAMTSKVDYCKKYGINITDNEFPYCIPQFILADRGEIVNSQIETSIQGLGIAIQNSPAYRADYKGVIEQSFHVMNLKVKPFADGVVINGKNKIERGQDDYRLKATLTLEEVTKMILKCVIFHNNSHVLSEKVAQEMMFEDNIEKIPIKIWNYGVQNKKGILRTLPDEFIKINMYPTASAKVTAKGISFKKMLYASAYTLKNGWFSKARTKGSWSIKVSYNPLDLGTIYFVEGDGKVCHSLGLVEHLQKYSNKSEFEVDEYLKQEREVNEEAKEKELSDKIKLFNEIEDIVDNAREIAKESKDTTLSKRQRLMGINENNRKEKELYRKSLFEYKEDKQEDIETTPEENDLDIFDNIQEKYWENIYE